jgi:hypothetical protein
MTVQWPYSEDDNPSVVKDSLPFLEAKCLLLCSQEPAIKPYSESHELSPKRRLK